MKNKVLLALVICLPFISEAQRKFRYKYELVGGLIGTFFLGDLGGRDAIGTNFIRDLDFNGIRPGLQAGLRYKLGNYYALRSSLAFAWLRGDDKWTNEPFRNNRYLSFRAPILELNVVGEVFFTQEKTGHRYKIKKVKGLKSLNIQGYAFGGFGGLWFNPRGKYNGKWYSLQPLGTEGQGIIAGKDKYKRIALCLIYGIGAKYGINRYWSVGVEIGMRKTFTDYLDDVSTTYNTDTVTAMNGAVAGYFADPSQQQGQYPNSVEDGQQRGDPKDKDSYALLTFTVSYKLKYNRRKTRSKF
jgi:hypothetical protein